MTTEFIKTQIKEYESKMAQLEQRSEELDRLISEVINKAVKLDKESGEYMFNRERYNQLFKERTEIFFTHREYRTIVSSLNTILTSLETIANK